MILSGLKDISVIAGLSLSLPMRQHGFPSGKLH